MNYEVIDYVYYLHNKGQYNIYLLYILLCMYKITDASFWTKSKEFFKHSRDPIGVLWNALNLNKIESI